MNDSELHLEIQRIFCNIRRIRLFAKDISYEQLCGMFDKFSTVVDERRKEEEFRAVEREERERKRQELLKFISDEGFSVEQLLHGDITIDNKPKKRLPPKYEYTENGKIKNWNGSGRMPKIISEAIEQGRKLEEFKIKNE